MSQKPVMDQTDTGASESNGGEEFYSDSEVLAIQMEVIGGKRKGRCEC